MKKQPAKKRVNVSYTPTQKLSVVQQCLLPKVGGGRLPNSIRRVAVKPPTVPDVMRVIDGWKRRGDLSWERVAGSHVRHMWKQAVKWAHANPGMPISEDAFVDGRSAGGGRAKGRPPALPDTFLNEVFKAVAQLVSCNHGGRSNPSVSSYAHHAHHTRSPK